MRLGQMHGHQIQTRDAVIHGEAAPGLSGCQNSLPPGRQEAIVHPAVTVHSGVTVHL